MPTYEYKCKSCGHSFEIVQSMRDDALTECPECGGELRKVFAAPAISFKGSGFYATDHRKKGSSSASDKSEKGEKGEKGEKKDDKKPDAKADKPSGDGASKPDKSEKRGEPQKKAEPKPAAASPAKAKD